jgi:hypothetical protein
MFKYFSSQNLNTIDGDFQKTTPQKRFQAHKQQAR